jgi:hypothetical protein
MFQSWLDLASVNVNVHMAGKLWDHRGKIGLQQPIAIPDRIPDEHGDNPDSIGYLEHGQAEAGNLHFATLENKKGQFVRPSTASLQAALTSVDLFEDLVGWSPDPEPKEAYPIVTYTWVICYKEYEDARKAEALRDFLLYCLSKGQERAEPLGYVPLPKKMVKRVKAVVKQIHGLQKGSEP